MKIFQHIKQRFQNFRSGEQGAILVEFSLVLPLMLLFFAVTFESARMFWSYQAAVSGVRDASRYLARSAQVDICRTGVPQALDPTLVSSLLPIVEQDIDSNDIFPTQIVVTTVTPTVTCVPGAYRVNPAPIAAVTAQVTIQFPFGHILALFGDGLSSTTATITDQARIFGQ